MKAWAVILMMALAAVPAAGRKETGMTVIASGGRSEYRIIIPDKPSPVVRFAAEELRRFLGEISGASLKIVKESEARDRPGFLLGPCRRGNTPAVQRQMAALGEDGVLIKSIGRDLLLRGQNDRGQLYSVYVLLERYLGIRFLARDCTVIPRRAKVVLPAIEYAHTPPFMYRETLSFDSFPREIAARQRLNGPRSQCDAEVGARSRSSLTSTASPCWFPRKGISRSIRSILAWSRASESAPPCTGSSA